MSEERLRRLAIPQLAKAVLLYGEPSIELKIDPSLILCKFLVSHPRLFRV